MKLKKLFVALSMGALLAFSLCGITACSDNSKELITESLTEEIASLKNPDEAMLSELSSGLPTSVFAQLGLNTNDVIKALLEGFDGTVDDVKVDGKTAEATLTLSSRDFSQLESAMEEVTTEMTTNPEQFAGMSRNEITTWAGQQLMEKIKGLPIVQHEPTMIEYVLNGNTWEPAAGAEAKLTSAIFG